MSKVHCILAEFCSFVAIYSSRKLGAFETMSYIDCQKLEFKKIIHYLAACFFLEDMQEEYHGKSDLERQGFG